MIDKPSFLGQTVTIDLVEYSSPNGEKEVIPLSIFGWNKKAIRTQLQPHTSKPDYLESAEHSRNVVPKAEKKPKRNEEEEVLYDREPTYDPASVLERAPKAERDKARNQLKQSLSEVERSPLDISKTKVRGVDTPVRENPPTIEYKQKEESPTVKYGENPLLAVQEKVDIPLREDGVIDWQSIKLPNSDKEEIAKVVHKMFGEDASKPLSKEALERVREKYAEMFVKREEERIKSEKEEGKLSQRKREIGQEIAREGEQRRVGFENTIGREAINPAANPELVKEAMERVGGDKDKNPLQKGNRRRSIEDLKKFKTEMDEKREEINNWLKNNQNLDVSDPQQQKESIETAQKILTELNTQIGNIPIVEEVVEQENNQVVPTQEGVSEENQPTPQLNTHEKIPNEGQSQVKEGKKTNVGRTDTGKKTLLEPEGEPTDEELKEFMDGWDDDMDRVVDQNIPILEGGLTKEELEEQEKWLEGPYVDYRMNGGKLQNDPDSLNSVTRGLATVLSKRTQIADKDDTYITDLYNKVNPSGKVAYNLITGIAAFLEGLFDVELIKPVSELCGYLFGHPALPILEKLSESIKKMGEEDEENQKQKQLKKQQKKVVNLRASFGVPSNQIPTAQLGKQQIKNQMKLIKELTGGISDEDWRNLVTGSQEDRDSYLQEAFQKALEELSLESTGNYIQDLKIIRHRRKEEGLGVRTPTVPQGPTFTPGTSAKKQPTVVNPPTKKQPQNTEEVIRTQIEEENKAEVDDEIGKSIKVGKLKPEHKEEAEKKYERSKNKYIVLMEDEVKEKAEEYRNIEEATSNLTKEELDKLYRDTLDRLRTIDPIKQHQYAMGKLVEFLQDPEYVLEEENKQFKEAQEEFIRTLGDGLSEGEKSVQLVEFRDNVRGFIEEGYSVEESIEKVKRGEKSTINKEGTPTKVVGDSNPTMIGEEPRRTNIAGEELKEPKQTTVSPTGQSTEVYKNKQRLQLPEGEEERINKEELNRKINGLISKYKDYKSTKEKPFPSAGSETDEEDIGDLAAVIAGSKPAALLNMEVMKNNEYIQPLLEKAKELGLSIGEIRRFGGAGNIKDLVVGTKKNVQNLVRLYDEYVGKKNPDWKFHKQVGENLGYSEDVIEDYLNKQRDYKPQWSNQHQKMYQVGEKSIDSADLEIGQKQEYKSLYKRLVGSFSPKAVEELLKAKVNFYKNPEAVGELVKKYGGELAERVERGDKIGGVYFPVQNEAHMDGGLQNVPGLKKTNEVWTHELWHRLGSCLNKLSKEIKPIDQSKEWVEAYNLEINKDDEPISKYSRRDPREGFAEFGRTIVEALKRGELEEIEKKFPRCSEIVKKNGFWPVEDSNNVRRLRGKYKPSTRKNIYKNNRRSLVDNKVPM